MATDHRLLPVSLVIPTLDRQQIARETVESILAGDTLPRELILADQSRVPVDPPPMPVGVDLIHLRLTNASLSGGRNAAIAAAGCDTLVFIDDDVRVESDWLRRLVEPLAAAPERTAVTGAVLAPPGAEEVGHVPSITYGDQPMTYSGRIYADVLFPNNMALRRSAFDEVGTFDERLGAGSDFPCSEDNDLGFRLLEAGYEIRFLPDAIVYHLGIRRGWALVRLNWIYGRGQGGFYAKHMKRRDPYMWQRWRRNAAYRLRWVARGLRGDRAAVREAAYLAGMVQGTVGWWLKYGRRSRADG